MVNREEERKRERERARLVQAVWLFAEAVRYDIAFARPQATVMVVGKEAGEKLYGRLRSGKAGRPRRREMYQVIMSECRSIIMRWC